MSSYVKRVHFKLHESYANQNRGKLKFFINKAVWIMHFQYIFAQFSNCCIKSYFLVKSSLIHYNKNL